MSADATDLVRLRLEAGADPGALACLPSRARRAVTVATAAGAPVGEALEGAIAAEEDERRAERAVTVACAQSRTVAIGLLVAPLVMVPGLGRLLDVDLLGFYGRPLGWLVGGIVLLLLAAGSGAVMLLLRRVRHAAAAPPTRGGLLPAVVAAVAVGWMVAWWLAPLTGLLVARARPRDEIAPGTDEVADLLATALAGGVAPSSAVREVAAARPDLAVPLGRLAHDLDLGVEDGAHPVPLDRVASVLRTATDVGVPAAGALRRLATDLRAQELARALAAAERLPAQLTFPTALCLLPAVLLAIGAPIVHAGLVAAGT